MTLLNKIKKYTLITVGTILTCSTLYLGTLNGTSYIDDIFYPKISKESELEQLLELEKKKVGRDLEVETILLPFDIGESGILCYIGDKKIYYICLGGSNSNQSALRHELYHIVDGHVDGMARYGLGFPDNVKCQLLYLFWYEPQAKIYEFTGLKP